jgi:putative transposase
MDDDESQSHTTWTCKYHVVFIPKCRRKALYQELRRYLGEVFRKLALQKESKVEEGHLMPTMSTCCCRFRRNTRCRRSSGSSRARARSIWPGSMESARQLRGPAFLGPWIVRQHGWPG